MCPTDAAGRTDMFAEQLNLRLRVNGVDRQLRDVDARVSLLDLLREQLDLTRRRDAIEASVGRAPCSSTGAG